MWLGRQADQLYAMKQFAKQGGKADSSVYIEIQIQQIIINNSEAAGKLEFS